MAIRQDGVSVRASHLLDLRRAPCPVPTQPCRVAPPKSLLRTCCSVRPCISPPLVKVGAHDGEPIANGKGGETVRRHGHLMSGKGAANTAPVRIVIVVHPSIRSDPSNTTRAPFIDFAVQHTNEGDVDEAMKRKQKAQEHNRRKKKFVSRTLQATSHAH